MYHDVSPLSYSSPHPSSLPQVPRRPWSVTTPCLSPTPNPALARQPFNHDNVVATYRRLITRMPKANQYLLLYVLDLLSVFARKSDKNLMTAASPSLPLLVSPSLTPPRSCRHLSSRSHLSPEPRALPRRTSTQPKGPRVSHCSAGFLLVRHTTSTAFRPFLILAPTTPPHPP